MIRGLGIDVMLIDRIQKSMRNERFVSRVFGPEESEYLKTRGSPDQSAAGIFAAKEAVLKALGHGIGFMPLRDIQILHDAYGSPRVEMPLEAGRIMVSITHMGNVAAAVAVWEVDEPDCGSVSTLRETDLGRLSGEEE